MVTFFFAHINWRWRPRSWKSSFTTSLQMIVISLNTPSQICKTRLTACKRMVLPIFRHGTQTPYHNWWGHNWTARETPTALAFQELVPPLMPQKDHRNCMGGKCTQNRGCEVHIPTRHWDPCSSCFQQGLFQEWGQMSPKAELPLLPPPTVRSSPSLSLVMRRLTETSAFLIIILVVIIIIIYSTQSHISPVRLQMPMDLLILSHNAHTLAV